MAIAVLDDVMLREPRLLVPRQQPVGPVKIDRSNPITNGLVFAFTGRHGVIGKTGSVSGRTIINGNVYGYGSYDYDPRIDTALVRPEVVAKPYIASNPSWAVIVYIADLDNGSTDCKQVGILFNATTNKLQGTYRFNTSALNGSNLATLTIAFPYNKHISIATSSDQNWVWMGEAGAGDWLVAGGRTGTDAVDSRKKISVGGSAVLHEYCWIYNRGLSAAERYSLYLDPYQVLVPA